MAAVNAREHLITSLKFQHKRFVNDLNAIPADQHNVSHAGCAHPPLYITAECGWVNGWIAEILQNGTAARLTQEEEDAFYAGFDTAEKALSYLQETTAKLISVYESLDESTLGDLLDSPFKQPRTRFAIAELPVHHLSYHDGQLNYIQALQGDNKIHW